MFPDNNLPEAYVLGMALLQVRADTNISQKIEEVKSKVSLDTLISFYKQSLHIRIVKRF